MVNALENMLNKTTLYDFMQGINGIYDSLANSIIVNKFIFYSMFLCNFAALPLLFRPWKFQLLPTKSSLKHFTKCKLLIFSNI